MEMKLYAQNGDILGSIRILVPAGGYALLWTTREPMNGFESAAVYVRDDLGIAIAVSRSDFETYDDYAEHVRRLESAGFRRFASPAYVEYITLSDVADILQSLEFDEIKMNGGNEGG